MVIDTEEENVGPVSKGVTSAPHISCIETKHKPSLKERSLSQSLCTWRKYLKKHAQNKWGRNQGF